MGEDIPFFLYDANGLSVCLSSCIELSVYLHTPPLVSLYKVSDWLCGLTAMGEDVPFSLYDANDLSIYVSVYLHSPPSCLFIR